MAEISKLSKKVAIVNKVEERKNSKKCQNHSESKESLVFNISKLIKEKIPKHKEAEAMI